MIKYYGIILGSEDMPAMLLGDAGMAAIYADMIKICAETGDIAQSEHWKKKAMKFKGWRKKSTDRAISDKTSVYREYADICRAFGDISEALEYYKKSMKEALKEGKTFFFLSSDYLPTLYKDIIDACNKLGKSKKAGRWEEKAEEFKNRSK